MSRWEISEEILRTLEQQLVAATLATNREARAREGIARSTPRRMAIDYIPLPDAHDLAHAEKGFYPAKIPVSHWQLRHYISTPEPDLLYYASGQDIYCLNTLTKKRRHIATIPFEARCTASGYGWVCAGGDEDGHFAAIKLDGSPQARQREVDVALPIDEHWRPNGVARRAASVKVERMGEEIVNSISIHRIRDEEAHLDDIVAVLTNNDKTVRIYSLPAGVETRVKDMPFAMNHATISPDGQTLVAVGDFNQAYFFQREIIDTPPQIPKPHNRLTSASVEWRLHHALALHVSSPEATIGFFTTAWAPNGRLVAVGSEGGYIVVVDVSILMDPRSKDQDAIVATVPGSRADLASPHPGAIRSMAFSPEPWDLLIWAEDQGRICVGDLRTALKKRQVVELDPKDDTLVKLRFDDAPPDEPPAAPAHIDDIEADLFRRYMALDHVSTPSFAAESIEARRRLRQQRQDAASPPAQGSASDLRRASEDDPQGLTAREQQVLETLRTARQREEARSNGQPPRSVNYTTPDLFTGSRPTTGSRNSLESTIVDDILNSVQESMPELSRTHAANPRPSSSHAHDPPNTLPPLRASQDGIWASARSAAFPRSSDTSRLPRRRASVVPNPLPSQNAPASASDGSASTPSSNATPPESGEDNPWRVIEEQISSAARGPLFESATRVRATPPLPASHRQIQAELQNELDTQQLIRLAQQQQQQQQRQRDRWRGARMNAMSIVAAGATSSAASTNGASTTDRPPTILLEARRPAPLPEGYEAMLRRSQARAFGAPSGPDIGVRTAGVAFSGNGGTVWAATEEGIFQVKLRLKERMFCPAIEPR